LLIVLIVVSSMIYCSGEKDSAEGYIELTYDFNSAEKIEPSFQTAIWMENSKGEYVKSLLVTEYLSMGGYNDTLICPNWIEAVDWETVPDEEFDAVTTPTPPVGSNRIKIDVSKEKLASGKYRICIQTHIEDDYNILYCGEIEIEGKATSSTVFKSYLPEPYPGVENALNNVSIKYNPKQE